MTRIKFTPSGRAFTRGAASDPAAVTERLYAPYTATSADGLDVTVARARALSRVEFERLFGVAGLEMVPVVAPGHLDAPPEGCRFYIRLRRAQSDRKRPVLQLVVPAEGAGNPRRLSLGVDATVLDAATVDAARLAALVRLAREAGRTRRGASWSVEEIENLLAVDVLKAFAKEYLVAPNAIVPESVFANYHQSLRAFAAAMPDLLLGDIAMAMQVRYARRANHRAATTRARDLYMARRALNLGLDLMGVRNYLVDFPIARPEPPDKIPWLPDWYDRLLAAADGWVFDAKGQPVMVDDGAGRRVHLRRTGRDLEARLVFTRAIPFMALTGTRKSVLPKLTWDECGKPLLHAAEGVVYREPRTAKRKRRKRGGKAVLPAQVTAAVRRWHATDTPVGIRHPFHKPDGSPYGRLNGAVFAHIVKDAGIPRRVTMHHLKDLCFEIARALGIPISAVAEYLSTRPETLSAYYGCETDLPTLSMVAERMSDLTPWRRWHLVLRGLPTLCESVGLPGPEADPAAPGSETAAPESPPCEPPAFEPPEPESAVPESAEPESAVPEPAVPAASAPETPRRP